MYITLTCLPMLFRGVAMHTCSLALRQPANASESDMMNQARTQDTYIRFYDVYMVTLAFWPVARLAGRTRGAQSTGRADGARELLPSTARRAC
jgi:hypothetical protein